MATIEEECAARNIDCLLHFTPVTHLDSILMRGLLVPSACRARSVGMRPNDPDRHDNQDAICLTVEWPNYKVFYPFRVSETRPVQHWAVIAVQHRVLWEKAVCFNTTNAADNLMRHQTFKARQGLRKFQEMFGDCSGKVRADLKLPDHFPTNPQAEVLCLETIEPAYFTAIYVADIEVYRHYRAHNPRANVRFDTTYFAPRVDHKHWKNG